MKPNNFTTETAVSQVPTVETLGTAILAGRFEDGSPEWHAQRANVIGGSEIGSILGVNSFQSRYVLWYKKAGFFTEPEGLENELFEWGHRLEPVVADKFADCHPEFDVQVSGSWVHKDRPWHGANPDRILAPIDIITDDEGNEWEIVGDPEAVLEIKTSKSGYGWERDMCPIKYVGQLRWYLECYGFDYGYLAVLASLGEYKEFLVPRDPNKPVISMQTGNEEWYSIGGQEFLDAGEEFYNSLPGKLTPEGTPPDMDGGNDTYEMIRELHPDILDKSVTVSAEFAAELKAAQEAEKAAVAELQRVKNLLLETMDKCRYAVVGEGESAYKIARRTSKSGGKPFLTLL